MDRGYTDDELHEVLEQLIEPFVAARGLELVELQLSGGRQKVLRLYADKPGGITIDDCAQLSRSVADLLDTHDPIRGSYVLQVSSPGLTRELKTARDFQRVMGRKVRVIADGGKEYLGTLELCDNGELVVAGDEGRSSVRLEDIRKANLHFE